MDDIDNKKEELIRQCKKIEANCFLPVIGSDTFYFHNIDIAEKITKEGRKIMSEMKEISIDEQKRK